MGDEDAWLIPSLAKQLTDVNPPNLFQTRPSDVGSLEKRLRHLNSPSSDEGGGLICRSRLSPQRENGVNIRNPQVSVGNLPSALLYRPLKWNMMDSPVNPIAGNSIWLLISLVVWMARARMHLAKQRWRDWRSSLCFHKKIRYLFRKFESWCIWFGVRSTRKRQSLSDKPKI